MEQKSSGITTEMKVFNAIYAFSMLISCTVTEAGTAQGLALVLFIAGILTAGKDAKTRNYYGESKVASPWFAIGGILYPIAVDITNKTWKNTVWFIVSYVGSYFVTLGVLSVL